MTAAFKLDATYLKKVGLDTLPTEEARVVLAHVYETLERSVGVALARSMTEEQLDEFEELIEADDEAGALKWLETHFPNYRDIVGEQLELVTAALASTAPLMLTLVGTDR